MNLYFLAIAFSLTQFALARVFYVDSAFNVAQDQTGSWLNPFSTIQACVNAISDAGDECQIRGGSYHEEVSITGLNGSPDNPIIIRGYEDERPLMDGTIEIETTSEWDNTGTGSIYRAKIKQDIWQLFDNGKMMINARWPNAKWSDDSIFNGTLWSRLAGSSERGLIINRGNSLKNTNLNMTGAMAILNIGSFNTFVAKVKDHKAGSNQFSFDDTFEDYHFKISKSRYFLEDKLNLLDVPEEWFYDKDSKMLHVYTSSGESPVKSKLRGKVQSYAFKITNSSHVIIKDIDFFATTLRADSTNATYKVNNITFHSLNFKYHAYSKRMLGDIGLIDWTNINGVYDRRRKNTWGIFTFFNNTFYGSDGLALAYSGRNVTLENNYFERNDFTAANMLVATGGLGTIKSFSIYDLFLRNTLHKNGASAGIRPGWIPQVKLNDISGQCWGLIQNDGAGVQVTTKPQVGCRLENNWVHDQPKYGLRFDGEPPKIGKSGTMSHNVVGRCNGMIVKGDYHTAINNLAFEKENGKDDDKQGAGCTLCILKYVRKNPVEINQHTTVENNVADVANGGKVIGGKGKLYPVAGSPVKNNVFGKRVQQLLMDPDNFDYRPLKNSAVAKQNAGPYSYMEKMTKYWIPGRQLYKASTPIPPHKSNTVKAIRRDAVMLLNAYGCNTHNVYFGTSLKKVKAADESSPEFLEKLADGENVAYLKSKVIRNKQYFWRVDAVTKDRNGNDVIYKGDVWSFKTK